MEIRILLVSAMDPDLPYESKGNISLSFYCKYPEVSGSCLYKERIRFSLVKKRIRILVVKLREPDPYWIRILEWIRMLRTKQWIHILLIKMKDPDPYCKYLVKFYYKFSKYPTFFFHSLYPHLEICETVSTSRFCTIIFWVWELIFWCKYDVTENMKLKIYMFLFPGFSIRIKEPP